MSQLPEHATRPTVKKRILNEVQAKILNEEKSDTVIGMKTGANISDRADMVFGCECDTEDCKERIAMSTQEYAKVHGKNMHFIVIPAHVRLDIEEIIVRFTNYCVVNKTFPQPSPT
jgi:hypothetical protein